MTLLSFHGVGLLLGRKLSQTHVVATTLIGGLVYSLLISVVGHFVSIFWATLMFMVCGLCSAFLSAYRREFSALEMKLPWVLSVYLSFCLFLTFYPSSYFDPLNYHLYGIVEWSKLDRLVHVPQAIQLMHVSYADYLYFPLAQWFDLTSQEGLLATQLAAQLLTLVLGICCFSFMTTALLGPRVPAGWIGVIALLALARASLQHKGLMAKNDWIAISWFVLGLKIFLEARPVNRIALAVAGLALGLSVGSKLTYAIPLVAVFGCVQLSSRKLNARQAIFTSAVMLTVLVPYLLRNYSWTGNPVFPIATTVFPSVFIGPSWVEGFKFFDAQLLALSWAVVFQKLVRFFTYEPAAYFFVLMPLIWRTTPSFVKHSWLASSIFFVGFVCMFGVNTEMRHFGPMAIVINMLGGLVLACLVEKRRFANTVKALAVSLVFFNILRLENQLHPIPSALRAGTFFPIEQTLLDEKRGLRLAATLSAHPLDARIGIIDDTPPYYLSAFDVIRIWDDPFLDRQLKGCGHLACVLDVLWEHHIEYLVSTDFQFDPYYQPGIYDLLTRGIAHFPKASVQNAGGEKLVSVQVLRQQLDQK